MKISLKFLLAKENNSHCGNQEKDAYDLKWQIEIAEKCETDLSDVIRERLCDDGLRDVQSRKSGDDLNERSEKTTDDKAPANPSRETNAAAFFLPQVEKHDDEKEKHHDGSRVNKHLHNGDKIGIQSDEHRCECDEGHHETHGAGYRVSQEDHTKRKSKHEE